MYFNNDKITHRFDCKTGDSLCPFIFLVFINDDVTGVKVMDNFNSRILLFAEWRDMELVIHSDLFTADICYLSNILPIVHISVLRLETARSN